MIQLKCDIVVVGGGASGMAAAASASESGASVIVLEKNASVGGNGLFPRGIFAVGSFLQKRKLVNTDKDEVFSACMEYSHWKIDPDLVRTLIEKSGDTIDWLHDMGVDFTDVVHHLPGQNPEVFHITEKDLNVGKTVIKILHDYCKDKNVEIQTGCTGSSLILSPDGIVAGVLAKNRDGEDVQVEASRVILCTGGFAGNQDMISKFYPKYKPDEVTPGPGMRHNGEGLKMAVEAGAAIEGNFAMEMAAPKIRGYAPLNLLLGKPWNVWINRKGKRFANEGIVYNFSLAANACLRQPKAQMWVVFDERIKNFTLEEGRDIVELIHFPPDSEQKLDDTILKAIDNGYLIKSDNLEDLAAFIGCPLESLTSSIEEYNKFCDSGRDAKYAKNIKNLKKLNNPPYYAIKAGVDMLITHGGIRVDDNFRALNENLEPVKNLYVAGVDFGGVDADVYNVTMSGHGFGFALNSGRIAGENAVATLKI
ncbi:MAG: FAD-dependent oxidoreductase [Spirochaetales bacterium]|nr:FAD-dependent oxidoreductase [Spirochaetales bacterium]